MIPDSRAMIEAITLSRYCAFVSVIQLSIPDKIERILNSMLFFSIVFSKV
jgi:hypothetical protein